MVGTKAQSPVKPVVKPTEPQDLGPEREQWGDLRSRHTWDHLDLYKAVRETLFVLPQHFKPSLNVSGVLATDLFTFNTSLGATIENQVVDALNELRDIWDSKKRYSLYRFVRQAQRFPDVILRGLTPANESEIIMGIELKGWYVLAKEGEPSFRYKVTPSVCAPWDLLVVYPWALSEVVSGSPQLYAPFVTGARYAAEYRNWKWQYGMKSKSSKKITLSTSSNFYPTKSDMIADKAELDKGTNFGRIARTGIMDDYKSSLYREALSGIPLEAWQRFFAIFSEDETEEAISTEVVRLVARFTKRTTSLTDETIENIGTHFAEIANLLVPSAPGQD